MQLLDVPFSAKKDKTGYYIKAADGEWPSFHIKAKAYNIT